MDALHGVDFLFECNGVSSARVNKKAVRSNMEEVLGRSEAAMDAYLQALALDPGSNLDSGSENQALLAKRSSNLNSIHPFFQPED